MSAKNKAMKAAAKIGAQHADQFKYAGCMPDVELALRRHELGDWLAKQMFLLVKKINDPYMDNFRWAEVGDERSEVLYAAASRKGCCGFADEVVVHPKTGRKFKIGFNFGH